MKHLLFLAFISTLLLGPAVAGVEGAINEPAMKGEAESKLVPAAYEANYCGADKYDSMIFKAIVNITMLFAVNPSEDLVLFRGASLDQAQSLGSGSNVH